MIKTDVSLPPPPADSHAWPLSVLATGQVAVRHTGSTELLRGSTILLARSVGNQTFLVTESSEHWVRAPLSFVVDQLAVFGLSRIHRATAVNMAHVCRVLGRGRHRLWLVLVTGAEIEVGRSYQAFVRTQLGARRQRRASTLVGAT